MKLTIDFETRSKCKLKDAGAYVYSTHESTEVMCLAIKEDDKPTKLFIPNKFRKKVTDADFPTIEISEMVHMFRMADEIHAHNAFFEICIYGNVLRRDYNFLPELPLDTWHCTMAKCYHASLPAKLEEAGKALLLPITKDDKGHRVMMQVSKPRKPTKNNPEIWWEDEVRLTTLFNYCIRDVDSEDCLDKALPPFSQGEREFWLKDMEINLRGIPIDVESVKAIIDALQEYEACLLKEFTEISTDKELVKPSQDKKFCEYLISQGETLNYKQNPKGETKPTLDASSVVSMLNSTFVNKHCRRMVEIRQKLAKASTKKYYKMINALAKDNTIKGTMQYHGSHTGREAGRLIQPQNMVRAGIPETKIEQYYNIFKNRNETMFFDDINETASQLLRGSIYHKDFFHTCDFSAIEGRVLAWCADDREAIQVYINKLDPYKYDAVSVFSGVRYEDIDKEQRQVGKTCNLALGFAGGAGAFNSFAEIFKVDISKLDVPSIIKAWRKNRRKTVKFWHDTERAFFDAVRNNNVKYQVGTRNIWVACDSQYLCVKLPSGRIMRYYKPRIDKDIAPWGDEVDIFSYIGTDPQTGKAVRLNCFRGLLVENIVQAIARDLLVFSIFEAEKKGYEVRFHVHDEIVCLKKGGSYKELEAIMSIVPHWAKGLPLAGEGWSATRYKK